MKEIIQQYLEKHGFEALCPKAVLFDMDGVLYNSMPNHAIAWQRSMEMFGIHMTEADAYATEGDALPETHIMPGIPELMAQINADGMTIGVVTGSGQRPLINRLMKDFGDYLDESHIVTAYDVKHGKPNPDPYLMGLQKAGNLKPWEAIVVENAPLGVKAGVAARIFTIAVNTGPLPDDVLKREGADLVLPDMPTLSKGWHSFF